MSAIVPRGRGVGAALCGRLALGEPTVGARSSE